MVGLIAYVLNGHPENARFLEWPYDNNQCHKSIIELQHGKTIFTLSYMFDLRKGLCIFHWQFTYIVHLMGAKMLYKLICVLRQTDLFLIESEHNIQLWAGILVQVTKYLIDRDGHLDQSEA